MSRKFFWIGFIVGALIFAAVGAKVFLTTVETPELSITEMKLEDLNGEPYAISSIGSKPTVVNFWATWCKPCIAEFPHFKEALEQYGDEVNFVFISDEKAKLIEKFETSKKYGFNYVRSPKPFSKYGIHAIPLTYFYHSNGKLIDSAAGNLDKALLEEKLSKLQ